MITETLYKLNTISQAIEDIRNGKIIIVVDDEDRENEGDFIASAELITPEIINFMSTHGRGLICTPLPEEVCDRLSLELMVGKNTDPKETAFTVSVDLIGSDVTTGISTNDRAKTIRALMSENAKPKDFARPGHVFPLRAKNGGVLKRAGHTEAATDLATLAGLKSGGVIVEIMNEDGTMARLPELIEIAKKHNLSIVSIKDLIAYRLENDSLIEETDSFAINSVYGNYHLKTFREKTNDLLHFALIKGNWTENDEVLVRVQSSQNQNDFFTALIKGEQTTMNKCADLIQNEGKGAIVFINNESDAHLTLRKLSHFKKFLNGETENPTLLMDKKDYGIGAQIIKNLGIQKIKLISRNINNAMSLDGFGLEIVETIQL